MDSYEGFFFCYFGFSKGLILDPRSSCLYSVVKSFQLFLSLDPFKVPVYSSKFLSKIFKISSLL